MQRVGSMGYTYKIRRTRDKEDKMPKITSGVVKRWAKEMGADIVGIASVERFDVLLLQR